MYSVSYNTIRDIENDLQAWMEDLPAEFKPGGECSPDILRIQQLLRMAYAHVQMVLYRPFLHYISERNHSNGIDQRSYACAAACVSVSRNIIHITADMKRNGLLVGSYWFTMYTTFFAILSLVFYALENAGISHDMMQDAKEGRDTLAALAKRSMAADRCTTTLAALFEQLSDNISAKQTDVDPKRSRKRDVQSSTSSRPNHYVRPSETKRPTSHPVRSVASAHPAKLAPRPYLTMPGSISQSPIDASRTDANTNNANPYLSRSDYFSSTSSPMLTSTHYQQYHGRSPFNQPNTLDHTSPLTAGFPKEFSNLPDLGNFSNLSAMMFPSPDPLAYPNQPMLTLEQSCEDQGFDFTASGLSYNPRAPMSSAGTGSAQTADHVDMQGFGHPQMAAHGQEQQFGASSVLEDANDPQMMYGHDTLSGNGNFPGLNFDNFFGNVGNNDYWRH